MKTLISIIALLIGLECTGQETVHLKSYGYYHAEQGDSSVNYSDELAYLHLSDKSFIIDINGEKEEYILHPLAPSYEGIIDGKRLVKFTYVRQPEGTSVRVIIHITMQDGVRCMLMTVADDRSIKGFIFCNYRDEQLKQI